MSAQVVPIITPDNTDFQRYMQETEPRVKVLPATAWRDALIRSTGPQQVEVAGAVLPWSKTHHDIRFRPGEVSLWQGINGHGKSQMLGQAILGFNQQKERACIASFEMRPIDTLKRMMRQASTAREPSAQFAERFASWLSGRLWLYDQLGTVKPQMVLAVGRYCAQELGIRHFVVDSLMKCVRDEDDYNGQKRFVDDLCTLARDNAMHVHLVHHAKKGKDEYDVPGKFDAKGSGSITDQVDNVFTVWRNKRKEENPERFPDAPDSMLICHKQRHGEWEGKVSLWYHADSLQYTGTEARKPIEFMGGLL
ncbi:hypothetical protein N5K27_22525 [Pigmentiphaga sp. GD03639]|uniref:AAA family ATPase n=1 Tax=Pigmentiphaga sp. GD03639 TaxID=2975354 RepID=UPI002449350B|nr:DnaB-like helicase C-terminal domain-containing protein [Pigmentiphaga sp. GD03639]MDH2239088.1 hypothetical protein [Pigmentiphaga sp. GD03639]